MSGCKIRQQCRRMASGLLRWLRRYRPMKENRRRLLTPIPSVAMASARNDGLT